MIFPKEKPRLRGTERNAMFRKNSHEDPPERGADEEWGGRGDERKYCFTFVLEAKPPSDLEGRELLFSAHRFGESM